MIRRTMLASLALVVLSAGTAMAGYETNKFDLKSKVEAGGWIVIWADDITETDAARGVAAAGVSVYSSNPGPFLAWVERLVDRTTASMLRSAKQRVPAAVEKKARQLAADIIKAAIRGKSAKSVFRNYDTFDFKAGAIKFSGRNVQKVYNVFKRRHETITLSTTWGLKPYVAFRWRGSAASSSSSSNRISIRYTIRNDSGRTVKFKLPSGRWYTLAPGKTGSYRNTGTSSALNIYWQTGKTKTTKVFSRTIRIPLTSKYQLRSGKYKFYWNSKSRQIGFYRYGS